MSETMSIDAISHDIKGLAVSRKSTGNVSPKELSYQWTIKRDWSRDCELSSPEFQVRGNKNGAWYMSLWDKDDHLDISLSLNGEAHQGTKVKLIFYFSVCNSNDDVIWTKTVACEFVPDKKCSVQLSKELFSLDMSKDLLVTLKVKQFKIKFQPNCRPQEVVKME